MGPHWKGTLIESENKNYKKRRGKRKKKRKKIELSFFDRKETQKFKTDK